MKKVEFILSLFSPCKYEYVPCFHKEGKTLCWNCPFDGNRNVQVLLHQWKMFLYTLFMYTELFKMCIWIHEILFVCANCIISQSSLFPFQINNTLLITLSYAANHSILMMDSKDKMLYDFCTENSKHCWPAPRLSTQWKFFWYQTFASSPFIVCVFQNCVPKYNLRDISLSKGSHSPS